MPASRNCGGPKARSVSCEVPRVLQDADLDVSEMHFVAVILQHYVTGSTLCKILDVAVFALRQQPIHSRRTQVELDHFLPVQPMLAVISTEHDHRRVPLANGFQLLARVRRNEIVKSPR